MKTYIIILFILGLGALTSYWGITSDRMARSFTESQASAAQVPDVKANEKGLVMPEHSEKLKEYYMIDLDHINSTSLTFSEQGVAP